MQFIQRLQHGCRWCQSRNTSSPIVFFLLLALGSSSWLTINSVWAEISGLAVTQPEGWAVASYITISVEISNICPLIYTIIYLILRRPSTQREDSCGIEAWLYITCFALAAFWTKHPLLKNHSGTLFACVFSAGMASTLSTIVMFPFVSRFSSSRYTLALQVGMTLSGSIPGILGLIQSPGAENPLFGITAFFCVMAIVMTGCCVCFCVLLAVQDRAIMPLSDQEITLDTVPFIAHSESQSQQSIDKPKRWYSGFWIITYAAMPYGTMTLQMCTLLALILSPIACLIPLISRYRPNGLLLIGIISLPFVYILGISLASPKPPFYDNAAVGGTLITLIYVFERIAISYSKTVVWMYANEQITLMQTNSSRLKWCGCAQQAGSFVGAFLFFILVNYSGLFVQ